MHNDLRFPLALHDALLSVCLTSGLEVNKEQQEISGTCLLVTVISVGVRTVSGKKRYLKLFLSFIMFGFVLK